LRKIFSPAAVCLALFLFTSCLGASMEIRIRPNGSGRIVLEYRVSRTLETMARFDGNERWPAIPVGRADFERTVARIPGLRLASFSTRNVSGDGGDGGDGDLVTRAVLDFAHPEALLGFLDATGSRAAFAPGGSAPMLRLVLLDPFPPIENRELLSLFREVSAGYEISVNVRTPRDILRVGLPELSGPARTERGGRNFSLAVDTGDIPAFTDGLYLDVFWQP